MTIEFGELLELELARKNQMLERKFAPEAICPLWLNLEKKL
jgi:hypothetical protein